MLLKLQSGEQQQTNSPGKAEPNPDQPLVTEPRADSNGAKQSPSDQGEPQIKNIHPAARHETEWLILCVSLAALTTGFFFGFAVGRTSK